MGAFFEYVDDKPDSFRIGLLHLIGAILCGVVAVGVGGWYWLLAWPMSSFLCVSAGYFWLGPAVFRKRNDGTRPLVGDIVLLPFLLGNWLVWLLLQAFRTEALTSQLYDGVAFGQRIHGGQVPEGTKTIVDLTCEYTAPESIRHNHTYLSFPILDGVCPEIAELEALFERLARQPRPIYFHCASGRGRAGMFAACLLLEEGVCEDAGAAIAYAKSKRPLVHLGRQQTGFVEEMAQRCRAGVPEPSSGAMDRT